MQQPEGCNHSTNRTAFEADVADLMAALNLLDLDASNNPKFVAADLSKVPAVAPGEAASVVSMATRIASRSTHSNSYCRN